MKLVNGSRVVIVGGGPAGSFAALHLLRFAAERDLRLEIVIYEARDFSRPGPGGCNKCAGILASLLVRNLERLQLSIPPEVIQSELDAYILHTEGKTFTVEQPDPQRRIISVYRGSGPRLGGNPHPHSFDAWLLGQAQARGAEVRKGRVRQVLRGRRPVVQTAREEIEADLVVLATGVNSRSPLEPGWGYRPPRTEIMAQDEIYLPEALADHAVHIFFDFPPGLIFGGIIPKGRYANLSLLGSSLPPDAVADFMDARKSDPLFPQDPLLLCGCTPRVAITPARGWCGDRMVAVGDAAVTRLYKDGIGSAFITAEAAAHAAVWRGLTWQDLDTGIRPVYEHIAKDNVYGRWLFRLWGLARRSPALLHYWRRVLMGEARLPARQVIHTKMLWSMFTGDEPYRTLVFRSFSRPALRNLWRGVELPGVKQGDRSEL